MAINAILTDIGGVTIENADIAPIVQRRVGLTNVAFRNIWSTQVARYGSGACSEIEFWEAFHRAGGSFVSTEEDVLGQALRQELKIREHTQEVLRRAGRVVMGIAALSDTILNHARVLEKTKVYDLYRSGVYLSHETGIRKPAIDAYENPLKALTSVEGVTPQTVLYIDDKHSNLIPAAALGMQTFHTEGSDEEVATALSELFARELMTHDEMSREQS